MKRGIAARLAVIFSVLLVLATGTVGLMVYQAARNSLISSSTERLRHAAEVIQVRTLAGVEAIRKDVDFLTSTPPVDGIVRARLKRGLDPETALLTSEWGEQLAEIFRVFLANRPSYLRASFVNLRGTPRTLVAIDQVSSGGAVPDRLSPAPELLRSFLPADTALTSGSVYLSEIEPTAATANSEGQVPVLHASMPVYDDAGLLFGAVVVSIDLSDLLGTVSSLAGPDNTLLLANAQGDLLDLPEGAFPIEDPSSLLSAFPSLENVPSGMASVGEGDQAGIAYFGRITYDDDPRHQLTVAVASPNALIMGGVNDVERRSIFIVLLFSIGGALLALGLAGLLTRPLIRITESLSDFGRAPSTADLPVDRSDEIGILARALDAMSRQIEDQMAVLEEKERRQRIILETASEGIVVTDERGLVEVFNPAAERLFGYRSEEIVGEHVAMLLPRQSTTSGACWREVGTGHDALARRRDGAEVSVSLSVSTFTVSGERKYGLFMIDMTERKEYEAALQEAKEEAEQMARLKTNFLASMSHEIRTPLTSVIGFASMLAGELPERHGRFAQVIERSGRRLMDTLNAVLSLAQLESQQMEVELDRLDVASEVEEVAEFFEPHATAKGLQFRCLVSPQARGAHAKLDHGALGSVLQNLIGNAIKFTDRGYVEVRVDASDQHVRIHVKDTGVGIQEAFIPYLFDAFRQESSGMTRSHEGSGLGLALTKRLVDLMDGEISVESDKGKGTTFTITFQRVRSDTDDASEEDASEEGSAADGAWMHARILVVDDSMETAFLVRNVLTEVGDVTLAFDGEEARRKFGRATYDLVLLDVNLGSGPSGVDLLQELRARETYREVPIVALTAYALPGDRERFLRIGFDDYISKPFTPDELQEQVFQMLRKAKEVSSDSE